MNNKEYTPIKSSMTAEELNNTWYTSFLSKALRKKFPFIKRIVSKGEGVIPGKTLVFFNGVVNPWEMAEFYKDEGLVTASFIRPERISPDDSLSLSTMFDLKDEHGIKHSAFNFVYKEIERDIENFLTEIHNETSIPKSLKFSGRPHVMYYYQTTK